MDERQFKNENDEEIRGLIQLIGVRDLFQFISSSCEASGCKACSEMLPLLKDSFDQGLEKIFTAFLCEKKAPETKAIREDGQGLKIERG